LLPLLFIESHYDAPFEQLPKRAYCKAHAYAEECENLSAFQIRHAKQKLPRDEGRDKTLKKVPNTIVVIPLKPQRRLQPVKNRHLGICVLRGNRKNQKMYPNQQIYEIGKTESAVSQTENGYSNDSRTDLE